MDLLGLSEEELCTALAADPLELLSDQLDHRPELGILLDLVSEAEAEVGAVVLRRWVRTRSPAGGGRDRVRPLDALLARDFARFEDQVAELRGRGFVLLGG